jgi:predicted DNA-binding transcriptional regulator AlpA
MADDKQGFGIGVLPMSKSESALPDRMAFTVDEFCLAHHVSRPFFYKLLKDGVGPRTMKLGSRTLISVEAATAWRREREAATQNKAAA